MRMFRRTAQRAGWAVVSGLLLMVTTALAQSKKNPPPDDGGGVVINALPCGGETNPCVPVAKITAHTFKSLPRAPESGPFTYTITVANQGSGSGLFEISCQSPAQVTCSASPNSFTLAKATSKTVTISYTTKGIGSFRQTLTAYAGSSSSSITVGPIPVSGAGIAVHYRPLDQGQFPAGEVLGATLSHSSGINPASFRVVIDGNDSTGGVSPAVVTATNLTKAGLNLIGGAHTWITYGCAVNGRCDSVRTTFTALGPPTVWSLDDSLPPPQGHGIEGLLGGLPLPPENLRGCPVMADAPEIRLSSPVSYLSQPGSSAAPGGLVFGAAVAMNDTLRIATATIDFKDSDNKTCAQYGYLPYSSFDWGWWTGTDPYDTLWTGYPFDDKSQLISLESSDAGEPDIRSYGFQLASLGRVYGPNVLDLAGALPASRPWLGGRDGAVRGAHGVPGNVHRGRASGTGLRLPSPGAINPSSFRLTLNGTLIVSGPTPQTTGVTVEYVRLGGASVKLPANHSLLRSFDPAAPLANSGGWNELIATIADSTGNMTSVRARFVNLIPGNVAPVALTALRDFSKVDQGECAAVGVFQCGGVMLSYAIPGFVTRDKDRSLHLVYRSASQRLPAVLPVQLSVRREQKAPDSVHVFTLAGGLRLDSLRYAGTRGQVSGVGSSNLWEHADETRIVGAVLPPGSGNAAIRPVTATVRQFYPGATQENTVSQEVVQLTLSDTTATRFGQGWQLAEYSRLVFGQSFQGAPAAVWLSGDGSYAIFKQQGADWVSPPGETARLVQLPTVTNNAQYALYLDNGASIGFGVHGWQVYTADLLGNLTTYEVDSGSGLGRLNSITDPSGKRVVFNYGTGAAAGHVASIDLQSVGGPLDRMAELAYQTVGGGTGLSKIKIFRAAGPADSTLFGYRGGTAPGAFVDSIVDPRSTAARPVVTRFFYDTVTYTPESVQRPPDRFGVAVMYIRDQWRRAIPRIGKGRFTDLALERMVYPNQLRGTVISYANNPTDFRVDRFGNPTFVSVISQGTVGGGFYVPSSAADDIRDIERDAMGRVTKIVHGRNVPENADSVMYQYDALSRVERMIRNTAAYPVAHALDTVSFTYDSVTLAANGAWCSRLLTMQDPMKGITSIGYGLTGAARCLPARTVGLASDTTLFTYGPLAAGDPAGVRPVQVRDPVGLADSVGYDPVSWNTAVHVRLGDLATSRSYYDRLGRPDSVLNAEGTVTEFRRDLSGRVTHQRSGTSGTSPTVRTIYDAGGLVTQTDVYAALPGDIVTPSGTVQSTPNYFDLLGQLDSTIVPGPREAGNKAARIQSFLRDRNGVPNYEFPGNGTYIARIADWRGRTVQADYSTVDYTRSVDGERFADASTLSLYQGLSLSVGPHLSAGQVYAYYFDNKGRPISTMGRDLYLGGSYLTQRAMGYSRTGAILGDTLKVSDSAAVMYRNYQYNRRGQRTQASDGIVISGASIGLEGTGTITYHYDSLTARLDSMVGTSGAGAVGRIRWLYDSGGRDTLMGVALGGSGAGEVITTRRYDAAGRSSFTETKNNGSVSDPASQNKAWFRFEQPTYDKLDNLRSASGIEPDFLTGRSYSHDYSTDGAWRLVHSQTAATSTITYNWTYDVFGNRLTENYGNTGATDCVGTAPMDYGADNRLLVKHTYPGCTTMSRYWTDQVGNRLVETDSLTGIADTRSILSYTAANQLYRSVTPTAALGSYDHNWHWYDGHGRRVISKLDQRTSVGGSTPNAPEGSWHYYLYDGDDVALTLQRIGTTWSVRQRIMSGGLDRPLVTRILGQNLAFVVDRQGTTLAAVRPDGLRDGNVAYFGRNAFGKLEGGAAGSTNTETGFTGASTPNQTGGFTYLRNRWYDPQSGRFLTQDPIGLAGGVNLYAYAGNNPVSFSDPFGLCKRRDDPACKFPGILGPAGTPGPGVAAGTLLTAIGERAKPVADRIVIGTSATALAGGGCSMAGGEGGCSVSVPLNSPSAGGSLDFGFKFRDGSEDRVTGSVSVGVGKHLGVTVTNEAFLINLGWSTPTALPFTVSVDIPPANDVHVDVGIEAKPDATAVR